MFVVGSIVIVLLGFPDVRWFVLGSIVAGARSWLPACLPGDRLALDRVAAGHLIPGTIMSIPTDDPRLTFQTRKPRTSSDLNVNAVTQA